LHDLPTEFHKNLPVGSNVIRGEGTQTDRQTGDLLSLTFLFKESRIKMRKIVLFFGKTIHTTYERFLCINDTIFFNKTS
jgi:hypothetical protein